MTACDDQEIRTLSARRPTESARVVNRGTPPKGPVYCMDVWQDQVVTGHMNGVVKLTSVTTQQEEPYSLQGFEKVVYVCMCVYMYVCVCIHRYEWSGQIDQCDYPAGGAVFAAGI